MKPTVTRANKAIEVKVGFHESLLLYEVGYCWEKVHTFSFLNNLTHIRFVNSKYPIVIVALASKSF